MDGPSTADFAREVDRLVIGVHRAVMQRHGTNLRTRVGALDLNSPGQLLDLVEFFAVSQGSPEIARLRFPYDPVDMVTTLFDQLGKQRLIDTQLNPSAALLTLIEEILEARSETADVLWNAGVDEALVGADAALSHADGKLVGAFRTLPEPAPAALRLHHVLTGMRYARLDAHVAAWQTAGLDASEIAALSAAIGSEEEQPAPPGLVQRGWVSPRGLATAAGLQAREAIETDTNERCSAMFAAVDQPVSWYEALRALRSRLGSERE